MAKMFYTMQETAERLGVDEDKVKELGTSGKLQIFRDRDKVMFKRDQVDELAEENVGLSEPAIPSSEAIPLMPSSDTGIMEVSSDPSASGSGAAAADSAAGSGAPADSGIAVAGDSGVGSAAGDSGAPGGSAGTGGDSGVLLSDTGSGIDVFDADEVDSADPMAQTQVTAHEDEEDDLVLESIGSGSGLLDLTRESDDDTSLGGDELLDEISVGDSGADTKVGSMPGSSGTFESALDLDGSGVRAGAEGAEAVPAGAVAYADEPVDPVGSGLSVGLLLGATASLVIAMIAAFYAVAGLGSTFTKMVTDNANGVYTYGGILLGVCILFGVIGLVIGKVRG